MFLHLAAGGSSPFHLVGSSSSSLGAFGIVTDITFHPVALVVLAAGIWCYRSGVVRLTESGRPWAWWRTAAFAVAAMSFFGATLSGLDAFERTSFIDVSVQHALLSMVVPVFLAISSPLTLAIEALRPARSSWLRDACAGRIARIVSYPLVPASAYMIWFFVLYFTPIYRTSLHHAALWDVDNGVFVVLGFLFAWPLVATDPMPKVLGHGYRMLWILLTLPYFTVLGMSLESQTKTLAPGLPLFEVHAGGGVLWVFGDFVGILGVLAVLVQWCRLEERSASVRDRVLDPEAATQLAYWKANRRQAAVAAGLLTDEPGDPEGAEAPRTPAALGSGARLALAPGPPATSAGTAATNSES